MGAIALAALGLLRKHLQDPFDLSLINIGAAGFSDGTAAAGTRSITDMFSGGRPVAAATETGAAAAAGMDGAITQQQRSDLALPQPQRQPAGSPAGRTAAVASAEQRRSYSGAALQAPLLSKRHERQLRERGAPLPPPQQHQQQQQSRQQGGDGLGFPSEADGGEEDDSGMWEDLQSLSGRHTEGSSRKRSRAGAGLAALGSGEQKRQQQPAAPNPLPQTAWGGPAAVGPAVAGSSGAGSEGSGGGSRGGGRVVIHADVDSFYCAVRVLHGRLPLWAACCPSGIKPLQASSSMRGSSSCSRSSSSSNRHNVHPSIVSLGWPQDDPSSQSILLLLSSAASLHSVLA